MSAAVGERAIDFALSRSSGSLQVGFFGGEPLLQQPLMRHLADYARVGAGAATRVVFQLTTSGHTLDEDAAAFLGMNAFQVSLSVHGDDWISTRRRLETLEAAGVEPRTVLVADAPDASTLASRVEALGAAGARDVAISPNYYARWDQEARAALQQSYEQLARVYRRGGLGGIRFRLFESRLDALRTGVPLRASRCGVGRGRLAVGPDGSLFPCDRMAVDRTGAGVQIGHIATGLDEMRLRRVERERRRIPPACAACPNRAVCAQFCACVNVHLEGRVCAAPEVVCWHESMLADVIRGLWEEKRREGGMGQPPARHRAQMAAGLAVAALLAGSCSGGKAAHATKGSADGPTPAAAARAEATWVTYPERSSLRVMDKRGQTGFVRLRLLTELPPDRLRARLSADETKVAALVQERLTRVTLAALSDKATERAAATDLLRAIRRRTGLKAELQALRVDPGLSPQEIETLTTMGYIE